MKRLQTFFLFLSFSISLTLSAQNKYLDKGNRLYKERRYTLAIDNYEKGLELDYSITCLGKLGNCYRMNNKMQKAEEIFADVVKEERAKEKHFYYYAETLMANGKYEEAKKWFLKYDALEPEDGKGKRMAENCDKAQLITPLYKNVFIEDFAYNSEADDSAPVFFQDDIIFSSDRNMGVRLLKEKSGWTGRDYINLYISKKKESGGYESPKLYSSKLNALNKNTAYANFLPIGTEVYYTQNSSHASRKSTYNMQLYQATSSDGKKWKSVDVLPFCTKELNYMHPAISPDGKFLFFVAEKSGGIGGTDIYVAKRRDDGWGKPKNLGPNINTKENEGFPYVNKDGQLYFCSKGHAGYGGFDLFTSTQQLDGSWGKSINLGQPINSPSDDISICFDTDNQRGLFTSSRAGGDDDIYFFEINSTKKNEVEMLAENPVQDNESIDMDKNEAVEIKEEIAVDEVVKIMDEEEVVNDKVFDIEDEIIVEEKLVLESVKDEVFPESELEHKIMEDAEKESSISTKEIVKTDVDVKIAEKEMQEKGEDFVNKETEIKEPEVNSNIVVVEESVKDRISLPVMEESIKQEEKQESIVKVTPEEFYTLLMKSEEEGRSLMGTKYILKNMNYRDQKDVKINTEMKKELDKLSITLKNYEKLRIEIIAHTESRGVESSNRTIAYFRAAAIASYLQSKGLTGNRVTAKGVGESQLLNHCGDEVECSEEEHLENRRIEIRISGQ